jgi:hypothetical protein
MGKPQFDPGTSQHTYRVEVKGKDIKLLVDGNVIAEATDTDQQGGGMIGLTSSQTQLTISSFTVFSL